VTSGTCTRAARVVRQRGLDAHTAARLGPQVPGGTDAPIIEGAPFEVSDAAAGALVEAVAGSVLEAMGEEPCIARLRGLPWSYCGKEVCEFLAGVNVSLQPEAVTMLHNAAGEAFVTLQSQAMLHEVLQANFQQIGRRYVEIFASTAAEKAAACERNRATMRDDAGYRGVLRMRGLPFTATVEDILQFFNSPPTLQLNNIHLMRKSDGRSSGDAYAVFDSEEAAVEALQFDKQKLGTRWCATPVCRVPWHTATLRCALYPRHVAGGRSIAAVCRLRWLALSDAHRRHRRCLLVQGGPLSIEQGRAVLAHFARWHHAQWRRYLGCCCGAAAPERAR
jgi:heterogeneous nuclear ribonucleoprotein F/H